MALDNAPCSCCPVCFAELEQPEEMHCPECGSLEGMELLRRGSSSRTKAKLFCYNWASGLVAPFRKADLKVARAAIKAASEKLKSAHGIDAACVADLGCGDAEVLIDAAVNTGIRGWGAELDAELVAKARELSTEAHADVCIEEADIMTLQARQFDAGTVVFCYLLPSGLSKLMPVLREVLERQDCVLTTLTWPVPGLHDRLCSSTDGFHIYCSDAPRD